ncbi:hypothetical protein [uncultured Clostridium sp.]|uniref:hypothetical protein n=1 Tax=uncultured Clostridium sp. TaxID=59620 RepID=UPI0028E1EE6C|nr:hypothetical protein [uncultured Clostridium sp.]
MYCQQCGNETNNNAIFCDKCGNKIIENNFQSNDNFIEEFYIEPLSTSIIKGIDFIPNCIGKLFGAFGSQTYFYCHIFGYFVCIIGILPIWIISSIIVTLYRIFMIPKLKKDNVI